MKLGYKDQGKGRPVVLLHAFPLSSSMWDAQAKASAAAGFRLILPDLPGFGASTKFSEISTMEDMALSVISLLDSLEIERAAIGGLSMGGYVTLSMLRLQPERFAALILCDTTSAADTPEKRSARFEMISSLELSGSDALVDRMLPNLISDHTKARNPSLVARLKKEFLDVDPEAAASALRGMAERLDHSDLLASVAVPALLLFGEHDTVTNVASATDMKAGIRDSQLVTIKNAGHYSNLEQPDDFNRALFGFLDGLQY